MKRKHLHLAIPLILITLLSVSWMPGTDTLSPITFEEEKSPRQTVKIALLLDTSNSMDGLINQAKAQLWDIVNEFTHVRCGDHRRPNLEIALYQYGNDDLSAREGYIQQVMGFSSDLDEISEHLFSLRTHGGEEYCGQVIHTSLRQLDWGSNPHDLKMIFIAGNEPFTQGKLDYRDAVNQAKEKDVVINTIFCGDFHLGVRTGWKHGAILSGGEYMAIDHNHQWVQVHTPYDDIILKLNDRLNKTYIAYGALGAHKSAAQATQDANAMEMEEAVAVKRAISKSSRLYNNSSWDLVDAAKDEDFDFSKLKKEQLPSSLQNKSTAELQAYVQQQKQARDAVQKEIQELNRKRELYIAEHQKDAKGELEQAMLQAIKNQAKQKKYTWDE